MKRVFVMRHGKQETIDDGTIWRREAPLSSAGAEVVRAAAKKHLGGIMFSRVVSSPLRRAKQSAMCAMDYLDHERLTYEMSEALGPKDESAWEEMYPRAIKEGKADTPAKFFEVASELLLEHGNRAFQLISSIVEEMNEEQAALLVTHNPIAEMAVAVAVHEEVPSLNLKNADIVVLHFVDGHFSHHEYLPA